MTPWPSSSMGSTALRSKRGSRLKVKPRVPIRVEIVVADVGKDGIDTAIYLPWGGIRVR